MKKQKLFAAALALCLTAGLGSSAFAAGAAAGESFTLPCHVTKFHEEMGIAQDGMKKGFVNKDLRLVTPCIYNEVKDFSEGFAVVRSGDLWGYVDKTGREVIPCQYDKTEDFSDGMARVCFHEPLSSDGYRCKYGFIDTNGKSIVPCMYDEAGDFSEGLAKVGMFLEGVTYGIPTDGIDHYGYIDRTGREVVPCKYVFAGDFHEGLAQVATGSPINPQYGFIDPTGKEVIPCTYGHVEDFSEGLATVSRGTKLGLIDKTGHEVVPCGTYEKIRKFSDGLACVKKDGKWGYIDKNGNEVIPCQYNVDVDFSDGLAIQGLENKIVAIDKTGKEVLALARTNTLSSVSAFSEGLAVFKEGEKIENSPGDVNLHFGFIDKSGKEVVPCRYNDAESFSGGFARVRNAGGDGLIDKNGNEVIPCAYDLILRISDDAAMARKEDTYTLFKLDGGSASTPPSATTETVKPASSAATAYASTQSVLIDGKPVEFEAYALKDANGNDTNYIKLRDVALALSGSAAQFEVDYDGSISITTRKDYTANGSEMRTPFSGNREYKTNTSPVKINGQEANLTAITLTDDRGNGYTYFKLRDLGTALGFTVDWSAELGITITTK